MRLGRRVAAVVSAALVALCVAGCQRRNDQGAAAAFRPLDIGAPVPAYAARSLTGDSVRVGGTAPPTVLNVWATWCTSCREEMADLDSLEREFGPRGVRVIGVSVDEGDVARVRRFVDANRLAFTIAHDPTGSVQQRYQVVGVPTTFVIGSDGRLMWQHTGNIADAFGEVRAVVQRALTGGSAGSAAP